MAPSPSRTFVAATTLNHAAQKTRVVRLMPDKVLHLGFPVPYYYAVTLSHRPTGAANCILRGRLHCRTIPLRCGR